MNKKIEPLKENKFYVEKRGVSWLVAEIVNGAIIYSPMETLHSDFEELGVALTRTEIWEIFERRQQVWVSQRDQM